MIKWWGFERRSQDGHRQMTQAMCRKETMQIINQCEVKGKHMFFIIVRWFYKLYSELHSPNSFKRASFSFGLESFIHFGLIDLFLFIWSHNSVSKCAWILQHIKASRCQGKQMSRQADVKDTWWSMNQAIITLPLPCLLRPFNRFAVA